MPAHYYGLLSILAPLLIFVWVVKLSCSSIKFPLNFRFVYVKVIFLTVVIWFPQLCIVLILPLFVSQTSELQGL